MNDKLMACFTNPVTCKLLSDVQTRGRATTKELAQTNENIPQATLYRYLKKMVEAGILEVVEERPVRNVKEKVYGVAIYFEAEIERMVDDSSGQGYLSLFQQFCNGLISEFQAYTARENIDIERDGSGFFTVPFYATLEELEELGHKIQALLEPYHEREAAPGRQMRNIALVLTPPAEM